jgi:hypothetical protein
MSNNSVCPTFRKVLVASVFGVCLFLIPGGVQSATSNSATLQWAPNQESDLAGYLTYHGTNPGNYGPSLKIGNTTTYQYDNLEFNKTHYFSVTAFDTSGNVGLPSLEVSKAIGPDQLAEAAKLQEQQRLAEAAKLREQQQLAEAAQQKQQQLAEAAQQKQQQLAEAAQQKHQQLAEAAQQQEQQRLAKAAKQEQQQLAKAAKQEQQQLAKAAKQERKQLAKAEKLLAKIQKALAKSEQKLVTHADDPKAVSRLNKKTEKYSMVLAKIQEKYFINE